MICDLCGRVSAFLNMLPLKQPNGQLETYACNSCAAGSEAFCNHHLRPHRDYMDGTTACPYCIEEMVRQRSHHAGALVEKLVSSLSRDEIDEARDAAQIVAKTMDCDEDIAVLHLLASKAARTGISIDAVIHNAIKAPSIGYLLFQ